MPPAGTAATQVYWYDVDRHNPPWVDDRGLEEYVRRSTAVGGDTITPSCKEFEAPLINEIINPDRKVRPAPFKEDRAFLNRSAAPLEGGITVDPSISPLLCLNEMLINAGAAPCSAEECQHYVAECRAAATKATPATVSTVMRAIAEDRNLDFEGVDMRALKMRKMRFLATDIEEGGTLLIVDREDPVFVAVYRPRGSDGLMMVCPASDPKPFRRRVRNVSRLARYETELYTLKPAADDENPRQRRRAEVVRPPSDVVAEMAPAYRSGNPFSVLPRLEGKKTRRRQKGTKHSWRVRLLEQQRRQQLYDRAAVIGDDDEDDEADGI